MGLSEFDNSKTTILLVEDDSMVRAVIKEALRIKDYRVLEAAHGEQALSISKSLPQEIHLLLTDVVMPKIGGAAIATELTCERPEMSVLYISGFSRDVLESRGSLTPNDVMLLKPFALEDLLLTVETILRQNL